MDLEFSIVLFENEGYATARGNKGVQDILASSADAGYIKDGTYPIIFRLHPYCWKWWISPKQEEMNFSMFTPDSWLDRPLRKNKPIQQRLITALKDWQKKYLRANETIKLISSGKHILTWKPYAEMQKSTVLILSSIRWRIMLRQRSSQGTLSLRMFRETLRSNVWMTML